MRYIKQRDEHSCGAIAIINVLKWLGKDISMSSLSIMKRASRTSLEGTSEAGLKRALSTKVSTYGKWKQVKPKINLLDNHLKKGGIAIIGYTYQIGKKIEAHYVVCLDITPSGNYLLINEADHRSWKRKDRLPTKYYRTRAQMKFMLSNKIDPDPSELFLISKND